MELPYKIKVIVGVKPYIPKILFGQQDSGTCKITFDCFQTSTSSLQGIIYGTVTTKSPAGVITTYGDQYVIVDGAEVTFNVPTSSLAEVGNYTGEFIAYGYDNKKLTLCDFKYKVQAGIVTEDMINDDRVPVLTDLIVRNEAGYRNLLELSSEQQANAEVAFSRYDNATGKSYDNLPDRLDDYSSSLVEKANINKKIDLSYILQQNGIVIVGTGDSLNFNSYTFGTTKSEAALCDVGILSWSFLLRDAIHRNDNWFIEAEKILYRFVKSDSVFYYNDTDLYKMPFNGKVLNFVAKQNTETFIISHRHDNPNNKVILYMTYNPLNNCCSFDIYVDDVFQKNVNTKGTGKLNGGFEILSIELPVNRGAIHEIKLTNFVQTAASPQAGNVMQIFLCGIGTKYTPVYITGYGGKTSQWLLDNLNDRILQYNPDIVLITIGANDPWNGISAAQHETNLRNICTQIRTQNPNAQILLMTSTPQHNPNNIEDTTAPYGAYSLIRPYCDAMEKVAIDFGCYFVDLFKVFDNIPISLWRYDNVHMTHYGNTILARNVIQTLMPQAVHDKKMVDSDLTFNNSIFSLEPIRGNAFIQSPDTNGNFNIVFQSKNIPLLKAVKVDDSTIRIYTRYITPWNLVGLVNDISVAQYQSYGINLILKQVNFTYEYFEFKVINAATNAVTTSTEWTTYASSFKFKVIFY